MFLELLFASILSIILHLYILQKRKAVNLPGPKGYPIVGQLFNIEKTFHLFNYKMNEKYGDAVYFNIGREHKVLIGDLKLAKELFSNDYVNGRTVLKYFLLFEGEPLGIIDAEGSLWEVHRRFALRQLRDFGFAKTSMQSLILDEVNEFIENLRKTNSEPVDRIKERFSLAVVNSLWRIISGKRYNHDDPNLRKIIASLKKATEASSQTAGIVFYIPWTRYLMPKLTGYTATREAFQQLVSFVDEVVQEHKKTYQPDNCRDYIDAYIKEMKAETDPTSSFYGELAEKQLINTVADFFMAGNGTSSSTLWWSMLYLARYPEVQEKMHKEIISITGGNRQLELSDRPNSNYVLATLEEILRIAPIVPTGLSHTVTSDFTHNGVNYKKGTLVDLNIYYIQRNPKVWGEDSDSFRPERFLTGEGGTFKKNENVVTFSIGRRHCLGESMARDTLFLFLGNIVQNFEVLVDPSKPLPSLEPTPGFALMPQEYSAIFRPRN